MVVRDLGYDVVSQFRVHTDDGYADIDLLIADTLVGLEFDGRVKSGASTRSGLRTALCGRRSGRAGWKNWATTSCGSSGNRWKGPRCWTSGFAPWGPPGTSIGVVTHERHRTRPAPAAPQVR
jgi:hypothetical protein